MIKKILDFCIRERLVVLVAIVGVIAYGWYCDEEGAAWTRFPTWARTR